VDDSNPTWDNKSLDSCIRYWRILANSSGRAPENWNSQASELHVDRARD
jgi:hypothetical protein